MALIDRAPELSGAVAGALARIGDPEAFERVITLIGDTDTSVRQAAVSALNSLGHPSMPARIETLLTSDNALVRESGYPYRRILRLSLSA